MKIRNLAVLAVATACGLAGLASADDGRIYLWTGFGALFGWLAFTVYLDWLDRDMAQRK